MLDSHESWAQLSADRAKFIGYANFSVFAIVAVFVFLKLKLNRFRLFYFFISFEIQAHAPHTQICRTQNKIEKVQNAHPMRTFWNANRDIFGTFSMCTI